MIISKIRVDNSLPTLASSPNLEARFLSKLILGFLLPALTTEQRHCSQMQRITVHVHVCELLWVPDSIPVALVM